MFITPQGLSKIIHQLEGVLGADLFERSSNGMRPTESGTYFYENSRLMLDKLDETKTPRLHTMENIHGGSI